MSDIKYPSTTSKPVSTPPQLEVSYRADLVLRLYNEVFDPSVSTEPEMLISTLEADAVTRLAELDILVQDSIGSVPIEFVTGRNTRAFSPETALTRINVWCNSLNAEAAASVRVTGADVLGNITRGTDVDLGRHTLGHPIGTKTEVKLDLLGAASKRAWWAYAWPFAFASIEDINTDALRNRQSQDEEISARRLSAYTFSTYESYVVGYAWAKHIYERLSVATPSVPDPFVDNDYAKARLALENIPLTPTTCRVINQLTSDAVGPCGLKLLIIPPWLRSEHTPNTLQVRGFGAQIRNALYEWVEQIFEAVKEYRYVLELAKWYPALTTLPGAGKYKAEPLLSSTTIVTDGFNTDRDVSVTVAAFAARVEPTVRGKTVLKGMAHDNVGFIRYAPPVSYLHSCPIRRGHPAVWSLTPPSAWVPYATVTYDSVTFGRYYPEGPVAAKLPTILKRDENGDIVVDAAGNPKPFPPEEGTTYYITRERYVELAGVKIKFAIVPDKAMAVDRSGVPIPLSPTAHAILKLNADWEKLDMTTQLGELPLEEKYDLPLDRTVRNPGELVSSHLIGCVTP